MACGRRDGVKQLWVHVMCKASSPEGEASRWRNGLWGMVDVGWKMSLAMWMRLIRGVGAPGVRAQGQHVKTHVHVVAIVIARATICRQ